MSLVTILLRFAPFVLFGKGKVPEAVTFLGRHLPGAVMAMLVVYCLKDVSFGSVSGFLPQLLSVIVTAGSFVWKRNSLISIAAGTACYMLLVQCVFI